MIHKPIPIPQALRIPKAVEALDKEWKKLEAPEGKSPAWDVHGVRARKDVIKEAYRKNKAVHFAKVMALCHLKNYELAAQFQLYKGRIVYRGDLTRSLRSI